MDIKKGNVAVGGPVTMKDNLQSLRASRDKNSMTKMSLAENLRTHQNANSSLTSIGKSIRIQKGGMKNTPSWKRGTDLGPKFLFQPMALLQAYKRFTQGNPAEEIKFPRPVQLMDNC